MKQVLKGGIVVAGSGSFREDVLIYGEKVVTVGSPEEIGRLTNRDTGVVGAEGCLLFPGSVDAHIHFDLHVAGTATTDDFATGIKAAVRGGTTTIVDFGTWYIEESLADGLRNWHEKTDGRCSYDHSFHMPILDWNLFASREPDDMMEEGITSFRLYTIYDTQVDDKTIFEILCRLKEVGDITGVYYEDSGMITALQVEAKAAGKIGVENHPTTCPTATEAEAIDRLLRLVEVTGIPVIMAHLICKEGYDVITEARKRGQKAYAETCLQYLLMNDSLHSLPSMGAAKHVCAPSLRKEENSWCLWNALVDGTIQTVSADRYNFTVGQEAPGEDDFTRIPGRMSGVETRGALLYTYGMDGGRVTQGKMCQLLSENPAKLYGIYPAKGAIAPDSDADVIVLRPGVDGAVTAEDQVQNVDYAPLEGTGSTARIENVLLRGSQVARDHQMVVKKAGKLMKRGKYNLQSQKRLCIQLITCINTFFTEK